ncbi:hypothetical protein THAOC_00959 [Thalassiosira oceanica]|uniref:Uncharacterized protein n=1 Tax=Thalassiosira oceanica TaxID=159749 RepID=K0TEV3_THAOC|nr:hypothetical protein THAOC_00959 [Thalassiosira oceanica]|eukprot:EJK77223.1 hypothetical protein THAOC_00959 [Thalassiosira oceanica]
MLPRAAGDPGTSRCRPALSSQRRDGPGEDDGETPGRGDGRGRRRRRTREATTGRRLEGLAELEERTLSSDSGSIDFGPHVTGRRVASRDDLARGMRETSRAGRPGKFSGIAPKGQVLARIGVCQRKERGEAVSERRSKLELAKEPCFRHLDEG